ncbi:DUF3325 family protein [Orrella sp. JC864]|uniref:DUF3325 family protein n=1 Tax=Orrella sp. JC864 TaxID=3120298 RepID=UPI00300B1C7E
MMIQNAMLALLCLASLLCLALANERQGELLLGREPTAALRRAGALAGALLLAAALAWGRLRWGPGIGAVAWAGWFGVLAAVLVFHLHKWPRAGGPGAAVRLVASDPGRVLQRRAARVAGYDLLAALPLAFAAAVYSVPVKPVMRADAVQGQVGPWTYRLAEMDHAPPRLMAMGIPMKAFQLRFCQACDAEIRSAYLKVNKPRSLRGAGLAFSGNRWDRSVEIQLPSAMRPDAELWLTVEGKDGSVHHAAWPMAQLAPSTVAWFARR